MSRSFETAPAPPDPGAPVEVRRVQRALDAAVAEALDRKRRLGHYAVFWEDGQVVLRGEDAPTVADRSALVAGEPTPPWTAVEPPDRG